MSATMKNETEKRCGTCRLWDSRDAISKAGKIRRNVARRCLWVLDVPLPESIHPLETGRILTRYMRRDDGRLCECWQPKTIEPSP